jgi:NAD(P)-dependent dehydrogenase (short-subunit alcohol dehydrogenase family)
VQRLFEQTGPVDVVVNCAGFSNVGLITDTPVDQFRDVIDVCLTGAFIVAKHAPEDIASAVVFMCSPKSSWLTGEVLDLNGGAHLKRYPDILSHIMKLAEAQ